ncbi:MAG: TonB family protein [bacterium]|nr:TonB family protein [bacterium]
MAQWKNKIYLVMKSQFMGFSFKFLFFALLFTVLLHVLFILFWIEAFNFNKTAAKVKPPFQQIHLVNKVKKHFVEPVTDKQLVSSPKPDTSQKPHQADYVAEFDQKVEAETKSWKASPSENITAKPQSKSVPTPVELPSPSLTIQRENLPVGKTGIARPKVIHASPKIDLMPTLAQLAEMSGTPFNDHLENVETDAQTRLNTFEWKHATYFNRIKERIAQTWSPLDQIKRHDPYGALLGQQDRYTAVLITIDRTGQVVDTKIQTESGVYYLDDEAIRSFKVASPFPNPPQVIFSSSNLFSFTFGFNVNFDRGFFAGFN